MRFPITKPVFDESEVARIKSCLDSGWVTQGPRVAEFELQFAALHHVPFALATTSCTAALHLAVLALELKPGDEVIVPAFTWVTSASCVEYVGATPVFVDIKLDTFNLDVEALEAAITPRTKAVVAVHLFGLPADMEDVCRICSKHGIKIIEDAACAIGAKINDRCVGGFGDVGCFSLHPRKAITTGEGGVLTTGNASLAERVSIFRNHGASPGSPDDADFGMPWAMPKFEHLGFNLRLSDIQAAVGISQLEKVSAIIDERRQIARRYDELLSDCEEISCPVTPTAFFHTFQSYVIRVKSGRSSRNAMMLRLKEHGIQTRPGTHAVHRLTYFQEKYDLIESEFPNALKGEDTTITLPLYLGLSLGDQEFIVRCIKQALTQR